MPDSSVASCVLNILGSFSSSLALYKRLQEKRRRLRRTKKGDKVQTAEEQRLTRSLRLGPEHISQEYHHNLSSAGDSFAVGDAIAQTSLAEVLLRLNAGLVGIITSFLTSDKNEVQLDYKSLADLAERSRIDTCRALRSLLKRLTQLNTPSRAITTGREVTAPGNVKAASTSDLSSNHKRNKSSQIRPRIRGPTLAQVVIQDSSKPPRIALVRPGERRKKSRSPTVPSASKVRQGSFPATPPPIYTLSQPETQPVTGRAKPDSDIRRPRQKQSSPNVAPGRRPPGEGERTLHASKSTPRLQYTGPLPPPEAVPPVPHIRNTSTLATAVPCPPTPAAASTPTLIPRRRKPTPTYYSIATDSTKLGEIPLHKWAQPYDFDRMELLNREAYRHGWPNDLGEGVQGKRRRVGFLGLFRRRSD